MQIFYSSSCRPGVCRCQLYKHQWIPYTFNKTSTSMIHIACESKLRSVVKSLSDGRIHAQETGWQVVVQLCIMPGLSTHLVHEFKSGTKQLWDDRLVSSYPPRKLWLSLVGRIWGKRVITWPHQKPFNAFFSHLKKYSIMIICQ